MTRLKDFRTWICLAAAAGVMCGCTQKNETAPKAEDVVVLYEEIKAQPLAISSTLPGRIAARITSDVRPQVNGIIARRLFEEGSWVKEGDVLYEIEPELYRAAYLTAQASLAEAKASVQSLALIEARYRKLIKTGSISRQDLDNAVANHAQAVARDEKAKAELETARINLAYTKVRAPVSGRIGISSVTAGALVTANQETALAQIRQTDTVYADFSQSSSRAVALIKTLAKETMTAGVASRKVKLILEDGSVYGTLDGSRPIEGDLLLSEINVNRTTGSITLRALVENPDGILMPGMYVTAVLQEGVMNAALLVSQKTVLMDSEGKHFVYVLTPEDGGKFKVARRHVEIARSVDSRWLIKKGIDAGELIVSEGLQKVSDGKSVRAEPERGGKSAEADKQKVL